MTKMVIIKHFEQDV